MNQEIGALHVLFISAEADPLVKIGGLGDVAGTLPIAINRMASNMDQKIEVRVALPFHQTIKDKNFPITSMGSYLLATGKGLEEVHVFSYISDGTVYYLLDGKPVQKSPVPYSNDLQADAEKYTFFSLAAIHLPEFLNWPINILHSNDWHTALSVYALKKIDGHINPEIRTILSVHNLPFMGNGMEETEKDYGIPEYLHPHLPSWSRLLPLPTGLAAADLIIPVSPGYANEIQTSEYGCGLENLLSYRKKHIVGILNGIDSSKWDPGTDAIIHTNFEYSSIQLKEKNKVSLQKQLSMSVDTKIPLLAIISRLDYQKGIDLLVDGLYILSKTNKWQCIILGSGDPYLEMRIRNLQNDKPGQIHCTFGYDNTLAHQIYAGADIFLMPSRYEPCGISQMISQRYGTIPIARSTGGLVDTIINTTEKKPGSGYLFEDINATVFASRLTRALSDYQNSSLWTSMVNIAMKLDFSWELSVQKYIFEYKRVMNNIY
jgi:starch synthase